MSSEKIAEFEQYFQIAESNRVNLFAVDKHSVPQSPAQLEADIPPLFKLANEVSELEQSSLRPLRNLGDVAQELAVFLQAQSRKIDLIMSHILASEQPQDNAMYCDSYGGGGVKFTTSEQYTIGQAFRTKLFLQHEASAVYCYTEVIAIDKLDDGQKQYTLLFTAIRDSDQELVVRASLHAQTRQLKKRQQQQLHKPENEQPTEL
ncbi:MULTISPECIES: PilZ domain-containing protein [unclassified Pseudoalteromonas]|uniref:PilZ domain-containing protein n=1 Tax=unclassified Pseudoalteromonas TaxID=194690 RepID=UPI0025B337FF|nr:MULTISPECIES: PilZ domain-containing protein [unclassified Pseudoalteromonas]MDN3377663.1 PilZ domain-containing protein [Pseudoalteromonas sp. APC 3893]MDN3385859.1 PilZ domain-containing protein [Pseudoalteromonas sp. APC 4017]